MLIKYFVPLSAMGSWEQFQICFMFFYTPRVSVLLAHTFKFNNQVVQHQKLTKYVKCFTLEPCNFTLKYISGTRGQLFESWIALSNG